MLCSIVAIIITWMLPDVLHQHCQQQRKHVTIHPSCAPHLWGQIVERADPPHHCALSCPPCISSTSLSSPFPCQVPVYHFGNTQCLSFGPKFLEPWGRKWRFSLGLLYGIAYLPIPRRVRLLMAVGAPVKVTKTCRSDPKFQDVVNDTHQRYMTALRALYDKNKALYGWEDHPLVMH